MPDSNRQHTFGTAEDTAFLGRGTTAALIAARDWSATPLGSIRRWPECLKTAIAIVLRSQVPMVLLWGEDGTLLYNDAYAVFAGGRHPGLLGRKMSDARPELAGFHARAMKEVFEGGGTLAYRDEELTLRRHGRDDQVFVNLDYSPVVDERGQPAGMLAILVETTERVMAERRMTESTERFRAFLVASTTTMYRMSADWTEMRQLDGQGFLLDTMAPRTDWLRTYIHPDDQPLVMARINEAIHERKMFDLEHRVRLADGTLGWTHSRAVPIFNDDGEIVEWFGAASDVTARKRAENALREREDELRSMVDALPQLAWMADEKGWIYWYNRRWYAYTGTTLKEMEGWGWRKVHHPDHLDRVVARIQHSWDTGEPWEDTFPLRGADGQYRWFLSRAMPIKDARGKVVRWFGTNTDVTEQQKREDFQKLLIREISHRVKNSLAMVSALLHLQARSLDAAPRHALEDASARVRAVATVHDQLWRQADAREVDLAPFLSNLAGAVATAAPWHTTTVEVDPASVSADIAVPLGLLVNELVTNAYKYAYAPGKEGEVRINGTHAEEGCYRLEVADAGRGLPRDFDLAQPRGSLGFRIITNLAEHLSGTLTASQGHPGARFTLVFPLKDPQSCGSDEEQERGASL